MIFLLAPFLFVALLWFVSTGAILWLDRLPRETFIASLLGATVMAGLALAAILISMTDGSPFGAYVGFAAALAIWGWHEMSFLMGFVAGPRRAPLPPGTEGWRRFRLATAALIHHEVALAATALALVAISWGQANQTAALTFLLLFVMRLSTKLNIFLGVPNLAEEMLPDHLTYLKSYFRKRPLNPLFPLSIAGGLWLAAILLDAALTRDGGFATAAALMFALVALALLEHVFLVLPVRDAALWRWAMAAPARHRAISDPSFPSAIEDGAGIFHA